MQRVLSSAAKQVTGEQRLPKESVVSANEVRHVAEKHLVGLKESTWSQSADTVPIQRFAGLIRVQALSNHYRGFVAAVFF